MSVKKIFIVLITIVACVMIGALVLNTLLPNVTKTLINSTEDMIYKATKISFDFNNDGEGGDDGQNNTYTGEDDDTDTNVGVAGFE